MLRLRFLVFLFIYLLCSLPARAQSPVDQQLPVRKVGVWFVQPTTLSSWTICVGPNDDVVDSDIWSNFRKECKNIQTSKTVDVTSVSASCEGISNLSLSLSGDFAQSYSITSTTTLTLNGKTTRLSAAASGKYLGECPTDFPVGQKRLANGMKLGGAAKEKPPNFDQLVLEAQSNNPESQYQLGMIYLYAKGVQQDVVLAVRYFEQAAALEHAAAQFEVSIAYRAGYHVPKNESSAFAWALRSAQNGNSRAKLDVSNRYSAGNGAPIDRKVSFAWLKKLAETGDAFAQLSLGNHFLNGIDVDKNSEEAMHWFKRAAAQTESNDYTERAKRQVEKLQQKMSKEAGK